MSKLDRQAQKKIWERLGRVFPEPTTDNRLFMDLLNRKFKNDTTKRTDDTN